MRPIKFRFWNKVEMSEPHTLLDISKYSDFEGMREDLTVMQFTGLLDKNGTEIYEGDILNSEKDIVKVIFSFAQFSVSNNFETLPLTVWMCPSKPDCDIVGNIHENPELLGREQ